MYHDHVTLCGASPRAPLPPFYFRATPCPPRLVTTCKCMIHYLSIYLSILSICLSIYLSIHLSIMSVCLTQWMHDEYNGKQHRTVHATSDHVCKSRETRPKTARTKQNRSKPKKPVKSKLNTQKTFKTLENEWKPRNTPVGAMDPGTFWRGWLQCR